MGAVALVLAAVIILPMVFDAEPRRADTPVSVRIPGENEAPFAPKVPEKKLGERKTEANAEYVVPVGAFANPDGVIAKLAAAKLPYYTEAVKGNLTRVRAGPFASRAAAEKALEQLKGMGLAPGTVTTKAG